MDNDDLKNENKIKEERIQEAFESYKNIKNNTINYNLYVDG